MQILGAKEHEGGPGPKVEERVGDTQEQDAFPVFELRQELGGLGEGKAVSFQRLIWSEQSSTQAKLETTTHEHTHLT